MALTISKLLGETFRVGQAKITISRVRGAMVTLQIDAPRDIEIRRNAEPDEVVTDRHNPDCPGFGQKVR